MSLFFIYFPYWQLVMTSCFLLSTLTATLKRIGLVCQVLFTIEYGLKLATAPRRVAFVKAPANVVDLLAVAPFWLELIVQVCVEVSTGKQSDENGEGGVSGLLRTFRLFRVLRVFRLGARMRKLEIVADAVRDSVEVFGMLLLLLALALVVFSSLVYFCEQGEFVLHLNCRTCMAIGLKLFFNMLNRELDRRRPCG